MICVLVWAGATLAAQAQDPKLETGNESATLRVLHERLRHPEGDSHDDYLLACGVGNEKTVPLLLERFKHDFGFPEPPPELGQKFGFVCTQVHLVDALRRITNTDQGLFYTRWAKWWDANKDFSVDRWVRDGFVERGLHPSNPVDDRFAMELIETLTDERQFVVINASVLLRQAPHGKRMEWLDAAAWSGQPKRRMGALWFLENILKAGREDLIRKLATDPVPEVREKADAVLKARQAPQRQ